MSVLLGVQPEEKNMITESMEEHLKRMKDQNFQDHWINQPQAKPQRWFTSDRTDIDSSWQLQGGSQWVNDTNTSGPKIYKKPTNPNATLYVYDSLVKVTNAT